MNFTNKNKTDILKVYDQYFSGYLTGNIEKVAVLLDEAFIQMGTANREVFFNKQDAVQFMHETMHQVAGNLEFRNRDIRTEFFHEIVLISELSDVYALGGEEWLFYAKIRISTLLQQKEGEWKIIQQHASLPDMRTSDGENISIEKLISENVQLHEAVIRRTAELEQKQKDLEESNLALQKSIVDLRTTQSQLIQSEKMASLGVLTAGIAHEIQNPLNFVNNFSEMNEELIEELQTELHAGNIEEAIAISNELKGNEQKVSHHGKRADAIVKGMLQHSRVRTGKREPTNINALAEEYLRLSYHGLRAKDKSFNATMHMAFDDSIGKINIVQQDISRVLLNLFNNAFYAVHEKSKTPVEEYKPAVSVSTKKMDDKVEITVRDNGMGIPKILTGKIFQPFFTTKPTGQGTGLGLSLSYDIIKAHGGEIKVESSEGAGTNFIITLPA